MYLLPKVLFHPTTTMIKIRADKEDQIVIITLDSKEMFLAVKRKLAICQKKMLFTFQLRRQSRHGFRSR